MASVVIYSQTFLRESQSSTEICLCQMASLAEVYILCQLFIYPSLSCLKFGLSDQSISFH